MERPRPLNFDLTRILTPASMPEPERIKWAAIELRERLDVEQQIPEALDLDELVGELRRSFDAEGAACLTRLSRTKRRWLPSVMFHGAEPRLIDAPSFVEAIVEWISRARNSDLRGWIAAYLRHYESGHEGISELRAVLKDRLVSYSGVQRRLDHWRRHLAFFEEHGPEIAAGDYLGGGNDACEWLERVGLQGDLAMSAFVESMILSALRRCAQALPTHLDKTLDVLEMEQGHSKRPRSSLAIRAAASELLPVAGSSASDEIQDAMQPLFMRHLGDPRLPGSAPNWQAVSQDARDVFRQWLSRRDIEFFFELVGKSAGDPKWKYRAAFWRTYVSHIENTWVALGRDAQTLRNQARGGPHSAGSLRGTQRDQSVFFIRLAGYDILEWSHSGACRVWETGESPFEFGGRYYDREDLMCDDYIHRVIHHGSERYRWQYRFASWIRNHSGIKGDGTYRL